MLHPEAPDLAGVHSRKAATDGSAGAGWTAGFGGVPATRRGMWLPERKSNSRWDGAERVVRLREDRPEGMQAARPAGGARWAQPTAGGGGAEGTQAAPKRGRADRTGAGSSTSANARNIAGGWLACGPHDAGRMRATHRGMHANVRTNR